METRSEVYMNVRRLSDDIGALHRNGCDNAVVDVLGHFVDALAAKGVDPNDVARIVARHAEEAHPHYAAKSGELSEPSCSYHG